MSIKDPNPDLPLFGTLLVLRFFFFFLELESGIWETQNFMGLSLLLARTTGHLRKGSSHGKVCADQVCFRHTRYRFCETCHHNRIKRVIVLYQEQMKAKGKEIADAEAEQQAATDLHVGSLESLMTSRHEAMSAGYNNRAHQLEQSMGHEISMYMLVQKEFDGYLLELGADKERLMENERLELGELSSRQIEEAEVEVLGHRNWAWL